MPRASLSLLSVSRLHCAPRYRLASFLASLHTVARARRAQLKQGKIFKEIIEAMKDLVTDANLECGEEGLKLQVRARRAWSRAPRRPARRGLRASARALRRRLAAPRHARRPWTRATSR